MPIKPLLKRSLFLILFIHVLYVCHLVFLRAAGMGIVNRTSNHALIGTVILSGCMWLTYQGLKDQYNPLETAPTTWLFLISLGSLLSSIAFSVDFINGWIQSVPYILNTNTLSTYIFSLQLLLCDVALNSIIYSMAFHTTQSLKKKLLG